MSSLTNNANGAKRKNNKILPAPTYKLKALSGHLRKRHRLIRKSSWGVGGVE